MSYYIMRNMYFIGVAQCSYKIILGNKLLRFWVIFLSVIGHCKANLDILDYYVLVALFSYFTYSWVSIVWVTCTSLGVILIIFIVESVFGHCKVNLDILDYYILVALFSYLCILGPLQHEYVTGNTVHLEF